MKNLLLRIFAVFVLDALATIGASSIFGVNALTASFVAGLLAVTVVFQDLARSFISDGKLDQEEIDAAFRKSLEKE